MKYAIIEFYNGKNNSNVKGFLSIPDQFLYIWKIGFIRYLRDTYNVKGDVDIYPLNVPMLNTESMGKVPAGYTDMREDFEKAIKMDKYYPFNDEESLYIRRQWAEMDLTSPGYKYV